jgi:hypothetical protein
MTPEEAAAACDAAEAAAGDEEAKAAETDADDHAQGRPRR